MNLPTRRYRCCLLSCLLALTLAGCQDPDEIRRYQVARQEAKIRLLGAIFPREDRTWFFKLMGPVAAVEENATAFHQFIESVRFTGDKMKPVRWTAPEGWREEKGTGLRHATFRLGTREQPLELSVTSFEGEAGSVLANVNRWRGQVGLSPVDRAELGKIATEKKIGDVLTTIVDMAGPGGSSPPGMRS
jgi:hypothetical protein